MKKIEVHIGIAEATRRKGTFTVLFDTQTKIEIEPAGVFESSNNDITNIYIAALDQALEKLDSKCSVIFYVNSEICNYWAMEKSGKKEYRRKTKWNDILRKIKEKELDVEFKRSSNEVHRNTIDTPHD